MCCLSAESEYLCGTKIAVFKNEFSFLLFNTIIFDTVMKIKVSVLCRVVHLLSWTSLSSNFELCKVFEDKFRIPRNVFYNLGMKSWYFSPKTPQIFMGIISSEIWLKYSQLICIFIIKMRLSALLINNFALTSASGLFLNHMFNSCVVRSLF